LIDPELARPDVIFAQRKQFSRSQTAVDENAEHEMFSSMSLR
jgi:hypothetical protein